MKKLTLLLFISFPIFAFAHEGHHEEIWLEQIGSLHLILLHFPIALINMLAISELFFSLTKKVIFDFSAQFMLLATAILTPFTALFGLVYSFSSTYDGIMEAFLFWHMWLGIITAIVAVISAYLREWRGRGAAYLFCVILLLLLVNITGYFGGAITFG